MRKHFVSAAVVIASLSVAGVGFAQQESGSQSDLSNSQQQGWRDLQLQNQSGQQSNQSGQLNAQPAGSQQSGYSNYGTSGQPQGQIGQSGQIGQQGQSSQYQQQGYQSAQTAGQTQGQLSALDQVFLKDLAADNQFEIQLGQYAQNNAQSEHVKKIAEQIVKDHQNAQQQVQQVAQQSNVQLAQQLPQEKQEKLSAFQQLQGKQFDQMYISNQLAGHLHDVAVLTDLAQVAPDPQIKQLAQQLLPTMQHHREMLARAARQEGLPMPGMMHHGQPNAQTGSYEEHGTSSSGTSGSSSDLNNSGQSGSSLDQSNPGSNSDTNNR